MKCKSIGIFGFVISVMVVAFLGILVYAFTLEKTLIGADKVELRATWHRWVDSRQPLGSDLTNWLSGRSGLQIETNSYTVRGVRYQGLLAVTNLRGRLGMMVLTTNGCIIFLNENGRMEILAK